MATLDAGDTVSLPTGQTFQTIPRTDKLTGPMQSTFCSLCQQSSDSAVSLYEWHQSSYGMRAANALLIAYQPW